MKNLNTIANEWIENLNAIDIYPNKISKFEVNKRSMNRWGQTRLRNGVYSININYLLLEDEAPEEALVNTLVHELLHCVNGCMNHGEKWKRLSEEVNDCYNLKVSRRTATNEKFKKDEEYCKKVLQVKKDRRKTYACVCELCGKRFSKTGERAPKWYAHYENFRCQCGGKLKKVVDND